VQLDKITLTLRPRSAWESIDLGFRLARLHWQAMYLAWCAFFIPCFIIVLMLPISLWWQLFILWWFKPLYDYAMLYILSYKIFDEHIGLKSLYTTALPIFIKNRLFYMLTLGRFDFARSFTLPIWLLERVHGQAAQQRKKILHYNHVNYAIGLTLICLFLQQVLPLSLIPAFSLFQLEQLQWFNQLSLSFAQHETLVNFLKLLLITTAWSCIEPFYVGAGFTLYLNRRTVLEAWDIELVFKKMNLRLHHTVLLVTTLLCSVLFLTPATLHADTLPPQQAQYAIEEVLKEEVFNREKKQNIWQKRTQEKARDNATKQFNSLFSFWNTIGDILSFFAASTEFLIKAGLVFALILLLIYFRPQRVVLPNLNRIHSTTEQEWALHTTETYPKDITKAVLKLWQQQQAYAALSLLYRATLLILKKRDGVNIATSHTEEECLQRVQAAKLDSKLHHYFQQLVKTWMYLAYAQRLPTQTEMQQLCDTWQLYFGDYRL